MRYLIKKIQIPIMKKYKKGFILGNGMRARNGKNKINDNSRYKA